MLNLGIFVFLGIASKLDYLKNLGIDTIYLTPYHPSPMLDMGYDVADYYAIHPSLGTMADFDELINQLKKRGKIRNTSIPFSFSDFVS